MIDLLGSLVIPLAAWAAQLVAMVAWAALHGGVEIDTLSHHEALVEVARRTRPGGAS